jgi:hypothetical protein
MENEHSFNQQLNGSDAQSFRIEAVDGDLSRFFSIRPLGNGRYEIQDDTGTIGTVQLDEKNHAHCESQGCELDLPLLHAIRDQIQFHEDWKKIGYN